VAAVAVLAAFALQTLPHAEASLRPPSAIAVRTACDGFVKYRATVTWTAPPGGAGGYVVLRESLPDGTWTRAAVLHDPAATTYEDHGLGADTQYGYRVRATDGSRRSPPSRLATGKTPTFCFG
jgi:hypothetical protein